MRKASRLPFKILRKTGREKMDLSHWIWLKKPVVINFGTSVEVPKDLTEYYEVTPDHVIQTKGKVDVVLSKDITEREVDLVRKRGGILGIEFEKFPNLRQIKWTVTHAKKLLVARKEGKIYFFLITKPPKFSEENAKKLLEFLTEKLDKVKERPPKVKVVRKTNPQILLMKREELFKRAKEVFEQIMEEKLKELEKMDYEKVSLAPPKEGHLLLMISAGMADGQYERKILKGILKVEREIQEEEEKKITIEVPKAVLRVVDLENLTYEEIKEE